MRHSLTVVVLACARAVFASPHDQACVDTSHVVGRNGCTRFGTWAQRTAISMIGGVELVSHHFLAPDDYKDTSNGTLPYELMTDPALARSVVAAGTRLRFGLELGMFYLAEELDLETVTSGPPMIARYDGIAHQAHASSMIGSHEVLGYPQRFGYVSFAEECAFGLNFFRYSSDATTISHFVPDFELRGRASVWITPSVTLDVGAGVQVLDHHDASLIASVGFHGRPYGGR